MFIVFFLSFKDVMVPLALELGTWSPSVLAKEIHSTARNFSQLFVSQIINITEAVIPTLDIFWSVSLEFSGFVSLEAYVWLTKVFTDSFIAAWFKSNLRCPGKEWLCLLSAFILLLLEWKLPSTEGGYLSVIVWIHLNPNFLSKLHHTFKNFPVTVINISILEIG